MSARIGRHNALRRSLDHERFRQAVLDGLRNQDLAERFNIHPATAAKLAAPIRRGA